MLPPPIPRSWSGWRARADRGLRKEDSAEVDPPPSSVTRGTDGPGAIRKDLPAEHRVRDPHAPWERSLSDSTPTSESCGRCWRACSAPTVAPTQAARRDPPADRRLLRNPIGRSTRCLRSRDWCGCLTWSSHRGRAVSTPRHVIRRRHRLPRGGRARERPWARDTFHRRGMH